FNMRKLTDFLTGMGMGIAIALPILFYPKDLSGTSYQPLDNWQKVSHIEKNTIPQKNEEEIKLLAQAIYGEARGELNNHQYLQGVISSILTRKERKNKSLKEIIKNKGSNETYHYTCFDPKDPNSDKIKKINPNDEIWKVCYKIAEKALNKEIELESITNYFCSYGDPEKHKTKKLAKKYGIPGWAYKMEGNKFILDKNKKRIPRELVKLAKLNNGKTAFFYDFGNYF
ncbi:MAG: hypothetical protein ABH811_02255, partial [archaeon]